MRLVPALAALVLLTACAPAATVALGPDHPASPEAQATEYTLSVAALDPAPAPRLPTALRPAPSADRAGMDHAAMGHAGMDHAAMGHAAPAAQPVDHAAMGHAPAETRATGHAVMGHAASEARPSASPMAEALGAYLALHDALASDDQAGALAHGAHFAEAFDALAEAPPDSDPHFWHSRGADVQAVRAAAADLAGAADLAPARIAFGHASVPFARLVEAAGLPEGLELDRYRCGMAQGVPDGGIWLQRPGATRNPYFGAAMLTCGSRTGSLAASAGRDAHASH